MTLLDDSCRLSRLYVSATYHWSGGDVWPLTEPEAITGLGAKIRLSRRYISTTDIVTVRSFVVALSHQHVMLTSTRPRVIGDSFNFLFLPSAAVLRSQSEFDWLPSSTRRVQGRANMGFFTATHMFKFSDWSRQSSTCHPINVMLMMTI